jgi:uncharacterized protein (DUF2237 family)
VPRRKQALNTGVAPRVVLRATYQETLQYVSLEELKRHGLDLGVTLRRWWLRELG